MSFSTQAVAIISIVHLSQLNLLSSKTDSAFYFQSLQADSALSLIGKKSAAAFLREMQYSNLNLQPVWPVRKSKGRTGDCNVCPKSSAEGRKVRDFAPEKHGKC